MNFFEHQRKAKSNTTLLVFYFIAAVLLLMVGTHVAAVYALRFGMDTGTFDFFNPKIHLLILGRGSGSNGRSHAGIGCPQEGAEHRG